MACDTSKLEQYILDPFHKLRGALTDAITKVLLSTTRTSSSTHIIRVYFLAISRWIVCQMCCDNPESLEITPPALDYVELLVLHLLQKLVIPLPLSSESHSRWHTIRSLEDFNRRVLFLFPKSSGTWALEEVNARLANWRAASTTRRSKPTSALIVLPLDRIHKALKEVRNNCFQLPTHECSKLCLFHVIYFLNLFWLSVTSCVTRKG